LRAEAALFMRDHVLGVVSHDLRGPLNAIHSWGYVLERKVDTADAAAQRALSGIRSGVEQQVKLIEQFIDTTRAETKTLALGRSPLALRHLMEQSALEARASLASARQVTLHVESALVEEQISADSERLTQALWLMLAFATEASAAGSKVVLNGWWRAVRSARSSRSRHRRKRFWILTFRMCLKRLPALRQRCHGKPRALRGCSPCANVWLKRTAGPSNTTISPMAPPLRSGFACR
jgi:hypothetical protein